MPAINIHPMLDSIILLVVEQADDIASLEIRPSFSSAHKLSMSFQTIRSNSYSIKYSLVTFFGWWVEITFSASKKH